MHKCIFIGIDIQIRRGCCFAVINETGTLINSGWLSSPVTDAVELVQQLSGPRKVLAVGIDAPRMPLVTPREWYWNRNKRRYDKRSSQKGYGRQCEIVISAHGIANPQWTPLVSEAPEWMQRGFKLYEALEDLAKVHEVFPSASYNLLQGNTDIRIDADLSNENKRNQKYHQNKQ